MRILLVTWNYPPKVGGMEAMLSQLVSHLQSYADVRVFAPYEVSSEVDADGSAKIMRAQHRGLGWFAVDAVSSCCRLLRAERFDVIVAGSALVAPIVYVLGRLFGLPMVVNVYGLDLTYPNPLYQYVIRTLVPRFHHVVAISQATEEEAVRIGVPRDRISIVSPGLDFAEFEAMPCTNQIRRFYGLDGRLVLLSVGRLARRKGLVEFVQHSLASIVEVYPNAVLLIVGGNPDLSLAHKEDIRSLIEDEAHRRGLEDHVLMVGWLDRRDLVALYHVCDIFVLPGIHVPGDMEGFGIVLIEASATAKPIVSVKLGGITDAVVDGKSGILVDSGRWDEFSKSVLRLLEDESLRQRMGSFGRLRVKRYFDWPIVAERYAKDIASALQTRG